MMSVAKRTGWRVALLAALPLVAVGSTSASAGAQDREPLPRGVPDWNWDQVITSPATVWVCRRRVTRHGESLWRVNIVAKSKETRWEVSASGAVAALAAQAHARRLELRHPRAG